MRVNMQSQKFIFAKVEFCLLLRFFFSSCCSNISGRRIEKNTFDVSGIPLISSRIPLGAKIRMLLRSKLHVCKCEATSCMRECNYADRYDILARYLLFHVPDELRVINSPHEENWMWYAYFIFIIWHATSVFFSLIFAFSLSPIFLLPYVLSYLSAACSVATGRA